MNKAFLSFEILLSLLISSFIIVNIFYFQSQTLIEDKNQREQLVNKLDLTASKIFLQKNINEIKNLEYKNDSLYFKAELFLENISSYEKKENENSYELSFIYKEKIKQNWILKK